MGVSISYERDDLKRTVAAVESAIAASGYQFEQGKALAAYEEQLDNERSSNSTLNGNGQTHGKL